jgi:hypothetical protein
MTAGEGFDAWVDQELDTRSQDAAVPWTTYLLHFDRPYKHARHYTGNPESSGSLKVFRRVGGREFAELTPRLDAAEVDDSLFIRRIRFSGKAGRREAPHTGRVLRLDSGSDHFSCGQFRAGEHRLDDPPADPPATEAGTHDQRQACSGVRVPLDFGKADRCLVRARQPGEPPGHPSSPVLGGRVGGQAKHERGPAWAAQPALGLLILEPRSGDRQGVLAEVDELDRSHSASISGASDLMHRRQFGILERTPPYPSTTAEILNSGQKSRMTSRRFQSRGLICGYAKASGFPGRGNCRQLQQTVSDLGARLAEHQAGRGARLLQVAKAAGISWTLARTWPGGRPRERQLKTQGGASRRCPECGVRPRTPTDQRKDITAMRKPKDRSAESEPGTRPPEYVVVTWVSEQLRDRIRRCGPSLDEALRTTNTPERTSEPELEAEP